MTEEEILRIYSTEGLRRHEFLRTTKTVDLNPRATKPLTDDNLMVVKSEPTKRGPSRIDKRVIDGHTIWVVVHNGKEIQFSFEHIALAYMRALHPTWAAKEHKFSQPEESKRKRGRPKGSKNKPKSAHAQHTDKATAVQPQRNERGRWPKPAPLLDYQPQTEITQPQTEITQNEVDGANDGTVAVQTVVDKALAVVKAAGYRVSKPRQYRHKGKHKDRVGPTFVAEFADGVVTRMSTFTSLKNLDWGRGERLSQAAYQSRWRTRMLAQYREQNGGLRLTRWQYRQNAIDLIAPVPPAIVSAHFEQDGRVLAQHNAEGQR
jgi:hypothetical protein